MGKNIKGKTKIENRNDFRFLKSYYHVLNQLPTDEDKLSFLLAIIERQFTGIEVKLQGSAAIGYASIKYHIDSSIEGFNNYFGITPPTISPTISPTIPPMIPHTIPPIIPPMIQEEEEEKEEEKEKEEIKEEVKEEVIEKKFFDEKGYYEKNKSTIHYLMDKYELNIDEAIELQLQTEEVENAMNSIFK